MLARGESERRLISEPELVSRPGMLLSETAQICASVLHRLVAIGQGFDMRSMRQLCMRVRQLDRQRARRSSLSRRIRPSWSSGILQRAFR
ncbi:MAG: hypothetical protein DME78_08120 [Verrucomicrobia bacterium]|nr:MAG: hypothetical protein DME78_08120 [Verrucomicrobiota bacterium]